MKTNTKKLVQAALLTALTAVGAFLMFPLGALSFAMQDMFTVMAGVLLGWKWGMASQAAYVALGLIGLPIFTQGGGLAYVFQPTFGYIIGFAVGAYVTGVIANRRDRPGYDRLLTANFAGLAIVYLFGMVYYYLMSNFYLDSPIGLWPLFLYCFILAVPGDIALCILGAILGKRLIPLVREKGRVTYEQA